MKVMDWNPAICTGCTLCELVCSFVHKQECSLAMSRIRITKDREFGNHKALLCMQCIETHCVKSCPSEALHKDKETGAILVNRELCNGCEACVVACPMGGIHLDKEENIVFLCDLCGGDPECVKWCSREALTVKESVFAS